MLTRAQRKMLRQALADGNELIVGGVDETQPRPRRDVVARLLQAGFLKYNYSTLRETKYKVTQDGRKALAK